MSATTIRTGRCSGKRRIQVLRHKPLEMIGKYDSLIINAPMRLQMVYHKIFTEGKTQADAAKELGISVSYTKSLMRKLYAYLLERINR